MLYRKLFKYGRLAAMGYPSPGGENCPFPPNLPDMSWRHTCMCAASFQYYSKSGGELKQNITIKRHAYSYINTKFRTHLKRVHSGHYSGNLCQKLPGDEFPAEIWQITGTGFNWVRSHSQNFVLVLGMRISFNPQPTAGRPCFLSLTRACPPTEFCPQKFQKFYLNFL